MDLMQCMFIIRDVARGFPGIGWRKYDEQFQNNLVKIEFIFMTTIWGRSIADNYRYIMHLVLSKASRAGLFKVSSLKIC